MKVFRFTRIGNLTVSKKRGIAITFITWVVICSNTYTKQVWSIVYSFLGFVRASYAINERLHTFFLFNPSLGESRDDNLFDAMNGLEFIKAKQRGWAKRKKLELTGGTIPDRGEKNYLRNLPDNLFEELSGENMRCYNSGDGNETRDSKTRLAKMKALHSSSAIVVNLFQYWQGKDICPILNACNVWGRSCKPGQLLENVGSPSFHVVDVPHVPVDGTIRFEEHFEISEDKSRFPRTPNIDVFIRVGLPDIAIESKFAEPYRGGKHEGLKQKYIEELSFWKGLPNLYELAKEISPDDKKFRYLDAAQLIKHVLGLKRSFDKYNSNLGAGRHIKRGFHLLYLWYDVVGKDGFAHRREIEQFAEIARKDNVKFSHVTYQEVIMKLSKEFYEGNESYIDYLTDRYL